ncbi:MAG: rRNA adenine dimethyltransferase family protein [Candidatus Saccharibacteria bacterium]|nr:rRNA adenine dimethyltransferase family protein [Candidatus Saccharibacteria bacterium]
MPQKPILGQHWLVDDNHLNQIITQIDLKSHETVFEIGTGLGHLTDKLLQTQATVISLEYDHKLYLKNQNKYSNQAKLILRQGDIRHFPWDSLPNPYKICANIPYYLTANLFRQLTDIKNKPNQAVLLIPQVIAQKLIKLQKRSLLTVLVQTWYEVSPAQVVQAHFFQPPPQIDSQVIHLGLKSQTLELDVWRQFVKLLKFGFANPRKQLRGNLKHALKLTVQEIDYLLGSLSLDLRVRAEDLTDQQWQQLFVKLKNNL